MTIRNATALTIQIFVSKVMSLLFNILVRFVIVSLPRYKYLNFMAAVTICSDFGAQEKRKEWERLEISSRKLETCMFTFMFSSDSLKSPVKQEYPLLSPF